MSPTSSRSTTRRPVAARLALVVVLAALGWGWAAAPASAHASVSSTLPTDGAQLERTPTEVTLSFSEDVSVALGAVRVLDREGRRVDRGGIEVTGRQVAVAVEELPEGPYLVAWRAVSADSHPIHGSFTFVVGDGGGRIDDELIDSLLGDDGDGPWRAVGAGVRFLGYAGALLAVGLAVFLTFAHDRGDERAILIRTARVASLIGVAGVLLELPVRAALATGLGPDSITEPGVLRQLLGDSVGIGIAVTALTLVFLAIDGGRDRILSLGAVAALGIGVGIAGHTATTSPAALAVGSDAVHAGAAAVWLGGLVGCAVVLTKRRGSAAAAAPVVLRFSGVAGLALGAVAIAGAALGWTQVRSLDALTSTPYGQLLIAKVAVVGVVVLLGWVNRTRLVPALGRAVGGATTEPSNRPAAARLMRRTVIAEAALLVVVVGLTSVLVDVTPARSAVAAPFAGSAPLGDGRVEMTVDPTRTGTTTIHIYVYDQAGQLSDVAEGVELEFALPAAQVAGLERVPEPTGLGHWTLVGDDLSIAGTWTIDVVARVSLYEEQTATFDVQMKG